MLVGSIFDDSALLEVGSMELKMMRMELCWGHLDLMNQRVGFEIDQSIFHDLLELLCVY